MKLFFLGTFCSSMDLNTTDDEVKIPGISYEFKCESNANENDVKMLNITDDCPSISNDMISDIKVEEKAYSSHPVTVDISLDKDSSPIKDDLKKEGIISTMDLNTTDNEVKIPGIDYDFLKFENDEKVCDVKMLISEIKVEEETDFTHLMPFKIDSSRTNISVDKNSSPLRIKAEIKTEEMNSMMELNTADNYVKIPGINYDFYMFENIKKENDVQMMNVIDGCPAISNSKISEMKVEEKSDFSHVVRIDDSATDLILNEDSCTEQSHKSTDQVGRTGSDFFHLY